MKPGRIDIHHHFFAVDAMTDMDALVHDCAVGHVFPAMAHCRTSDVTVGATAA